MIAALVVYALFAPMVAFIGGLEYMRRRMPPTQINVAVPIPFGPAFTPPENTLQ